MLDRVDPLVPTPPGQPRPSPAPSSGSTRPIEGKYDVIAKIREGGMGAIYLVRHRLLEELRIIKVMRPEVAESEGQRKRFLREARTATRLKHPHIVGFYDFFVDDEGTAYMVMEYIEGINLRDLVRDCGPVPVTLAVHLSLQCLSALDYLHRKGIVHRDISPDNVMMTQEEGALNAKLIDLGIAKIAQTTEELTRADEFIGKLRYSSPEQLTRNASSGQIDGRSDIFSFGIVLYEILTGVCPYGGESLRDILTARLVEPPMPFEESDPQGRVPAALRAAIVRALQKLPEERYQTAQEFSRALEAGAHGERAPEDPDRVNLYVHDAIRLAMKAAAANYPAGASVQQTLQSKFRFLDASARRSTTEEVRLQKTLARLSDREATVIDVRSGTPADLDDNGEAAEKAAVPGEIVQHEAAVSPSRRRRYALAGLLGVLFVAAGFAIRASVTGKGRVSEAPKSSSRSGESSVARSAASDVPVRPLELTPGFPAVSIGSRDQPAPASQVAPLLPQPTEVPARPIRLTPAVAQKKLPEKKAERPNEKSAPAGSAIVAARESSKPRARYCSELEDTNYKQGVTKEVAGGFQDGAARAPRPDAGLMQIKISVLPAHPSEGEPSFLSVKFENGGDNPVTLEQVQESLSRGGYKTVGNLSLPVVINPGGVKELYQLPVSLEGDPWSKQFVAIDKRGDSWKATFHLRPCAD